MLQIHSPRPLLKKTATYSALDSDVRPVVGSVTGFTPAFVMCFSRRTNCAGLLPLWILLLAEGVVLDRKVADANTRRGEDRIR